MNVAQQTQQLQANQNQAGMNAAKVTKLRADHKLAKGELERASQIIKQLRDDMADANKDYVEAQEMLRVSKMKVARLRNDYTNASDAHGGIQGKIAMIQGQLAQFGVSA